MTSTPKLPYVSRLRPIEEIVDPEMHKFRQIYDKMMEEIRAMTREEFIQYQTKLGVYNADGTPKWPEGEPIGMPYPGDYDS